MLEIDWVLGRTDAVLMIRTGVLDQCEIRVTHYLLIGEGRWLYWGGGGICEKRAKW